MSNNTTSSNAHGIVTPKAAARLYRLGITSLEPLVQGPSPETTVGTLQEELWARHLKRTPLSEFQNALVAWAVWLLGRHATAEELADIASGTYHECMLRLVVLAEKATDAQISVKAMSDIVWPATDAVEAILGVLVDHVLAGGRAAIYESHETGAKRTITDADYDLAETFYEARKTLDAAAAEMKDLSVSATEVGTKSSDLSEN